MATLVEEVTLKKNISNFSCIKSSSLKKKIELNILGIPILLDDLKIRIKFRSSYDLYKSLLGLIEFTIINIWEVN